MSLVSAITAAIVGSAVGDALRRAAPGAAMAQGPLHDGAVATATLAALGLLQPAQPPVEAAPWDTERGPPQRAM